MSFQFQCPHCSAKLEAEDDWIGSETTCPNCSQTITIAPNTIQEKPKIQLAPVISQASPEVQRPRSTQSHLAKDSSASSKFPFICPSCGTLTELDSSLQNQEYECPACCEKAIAVPATERPCPYCGEMIKFQAKICRFCKKSVEPEKSSFPSSAQRNSTPPQLTPATSNTIVVKELDTLFFWWWLSLALAIPTLGIGTVASVVFFCILLYKYWCIVHTKTNHPVTPGIAVGYLFIPLFGIYWSFVSIWGLGKVFNVLTDLGKQKLETTPLIACICLVVYPVAWGLMVLFLVEEIFIPGFLFMLVFYAAVIGFIVFWIITMINFQKAAKNIIQWQ